MISSCPTPWFLSRNHIRTLTWDMTSICSLRHCYQSFITMGFLQPLYYAFFWDTCCIVIAPCVPTQFLLVLGIVGPSNTALFILDPRIFGAIRYFRKMIMFMCAWLEIFLLPLTSSLSNLFSLICADSYVHGQSWQAAIHIISFFHSC